MPIIDLQRKIQEAGRIRIGHQVPSAKGTRPAALKTFRLTSSSKALIEAAAKVYGGKVAQWEAPSGKQWEVITDADSLNVIVPPTELAFSQHYELWSAAGCARRCDGEFESISDGPCLCDPEDRECEIHTRLSVMLSDLPGLGVWRLDSQGYYAAAELQGIVRVLDVAARQGEMLPAVLRLTQRSVNRPGEPTKRFVVPVLDIVYTPAQLLSGRGLEPPAPVKNSELAGLAEQKKLDPVPQTDEAPATVAQQVARKPKSRRRAPAVPETGVAPRTGEQAQVQAAQSIKPSGPRQSAVVAPSQDQDPSQTSASPELRGPDQPSAEPEQPRAVCPECSGAGGLHAEGCTLDPWFPPPPPPPVTTAYLPGDEPNGASVALPEAPATKAQNGRMNALLGELGLTKENRDDRLALLSHILGRDVDTSRGLFVSEASAIIAEIERQCATGEQDEWVREVLNKAALAEVYAQEAMDLGTSDPEQAEAP